MTPEKGVPEQRPALRTLSWSPLSMFRASPEWEARILLLIDAFSRKQDGSPRLLEGRLKLAKLDFLLRYPSYLSRILAVRGTQTRAVRELDYAPWQEGPIDSRMMRYKYGPWDPAYYAILGALIGRQLILSEELPERPGVGYRTNQRGIEAAGLLKKDESFAPIVAITSVLRRHLDLSGTNLKRLVYLLPEVSDAAWQEEVK